MGQFSCSLLNIPCEHSWKEYIFKEVWKVENSKKLKRTLLKETWTSCSFPSFLDFGCSSLVCIDWMCGVSSCLGSSTSAAHPRTFGTLACQSRGTAIQHSTPAFLGPTRCVMVCGRSSWVLAFLGGTQGHIADPGFTEGEEATPYSLSLSKFIFSFFPLDQAPLYFLAYPF